MRYDSEDDRKVVTPTEARQASPRKLNLRVLVTSMLLAIGVGMLLYAAFYNRDL
jgi:hypothetical protein